MIEIRNCECLDSHIHRAVVAFSYVGAGEKAIDGSRMGPLHLFVVYDQARRSKADATHVTLQSEGWKSLEFSAGGFRTDELRRPGVLGFVTLGGMSKVGSELEKQFRALCDFVGRRIAEATREDLAAKAGGAQGVGRRRMQPRFGNDPRGFYFMENGTLWFKADDGRFCVRPPAKGEVIDGSLLEVFAKRGLTCATMIVVLANSACGEVFYIETWQDKVGSVADEIAMALAERTTSFPRMSTIEVLLGIWSFDGTPKAYRDLEPYCEAAAELYDRWGMEVTKRRVD